MPRSQPKALRDPFFFVSWNMCGIITTGKLETPCQGMLYDVLKAGMGSESAENYTISPPCVNNTTIANIGPDDDDDVQRVGSHSHFLLSL